MNSDLKVGKNKRIHKSVVLGYPSQREIKDRILTIGDNSDIRSGTVIYVGSKIGDNLTTGHNVVIREENKIGHNFSIWSNSIIDYNCSIGDYVRIHSNVYIAQFTIIEDNVFIAPGVITANDLYPVSAKGLKGPTIEKGAKIGVNVSILPRITIGKFSLVGAGSVVTKDIPPYSLAYGVPAVVVKKIKDIKEIEEAGVCRYEYE